MRKSANIALNPDLETGLNYAATIGARSMRQGASVEPQNPRERVYMRANPDKLRY